MAEKKGKEKEQEKTVNQLAKDLKEGSFQNLYLLYGSETYVCGQALNKLLKLLMPEQEEMNFSSFDEKTTEAAKLAELADTLPFFAQRRLILVRDSGLFKNGSEVLEDYLPRLPETTVLIFVEKEVDKRKKLYKTALSCGCCVEFKALTESEVQIQVVAILKREGKVMQRAAYNHLIERVGMQMQDLSVELEKLICYTYGRNEITQEDIDAVVSPRIEEQVFDLTNAIAEKQGKKALKCYYELMSMKTKPMSVIVTLEKQFNRLLMVKSMRARGLDHDKIAKSLGISVRAIPINERIASRFTMDSLKQALADCLAAEEAVKSGRMSDRLSLETLIIKYS